MSQISLDIQCQECPIRHRAVCAKCDSDELEALELIKYYRNYEAGQSIAWAGDELTFVASVVRGVASLSQTLEDGRTQMVGLLLPSDFIGRPGRAHSPYDVIAVSDVTLCCFRRKPFEQLLMTTPHVAERLLDMTLDELDAAREWMLILGRKTAREKIASLLAIIARRESVIGMSSLSGQININLPLTREAMADYLGLTLETVSRQISALKREGIIHLDGKRRIRVDDFQALLLETGDDMDGGMIP
ncbi:transcriptional regulator [Aestuarium zhoushanense]|uniref:transcriptional regulator FnrL n=1 Tax=Marivivens donghaensis TaxID=1699413 RepID=UPI000CA09B28|nr:Crp/Fnr family transcriptional regulator [Marivivens donghaensis]AUJ65093.1 transcriptional regulator [Aestuarium zhoushanense]MCL7409529.1 Crp/Fnr family transcriptional regulator [Marivivens donghaensis]MDN3703008.1 Crp/Fnr family transcriptional regulator [Marivivens donghaensis]